MSTTPPSQEAIAQRAYSLWEQAGKPAGRDEEFWLRAETELAASVSPGGSAGVAPPSVALPATPVAAPLHAVPPSIKDAVKTRPRGPAVRRAPRRM